MAAKPFKRAKSILFYSFIALVCLTFSGLTVAASTSTLKKIVKPAVVKTIKLPAVPGLTVQQVGPAIVLKWGKPSKNVSFANYIIYRSATSGKLGTAIGTPAKTSLSFTDTKALAGTTYYYSVTYTGKNTVPANGRQIKIRVTPSKIPASAMDSIEANTATTDSINSPAPTDLKQPDIFSSETPSVAPIKDANASADDLTRVTTLKELQVALALYFQSAGTYPEGTELVLGMGETSCLNTDGWGMSDDCPYPYFATIPKAPGSSMYTYNKTGESYTISVTLDGKVGMLSGTIVATPQGITKK
jgi:uncharacterized membrane protein